MLVPRPLEKFLCTDDLTRAVHEDREYRELLRRQIEQFPIPKRPVPRDVKDDAELVEDRRRADGRTPREGVDAGHQLGKCERLGQVVIRAQLQPVHPIADAARRGQDQDPGAELGVDDPSADRIAAGLGHVAVEHGHVIAVDAEPLHGHLAVVADVDGHSELAQALRNRVGEQPLVVGK